MVEDILRKFIHHKFNTYMVGIVGLSAKDQ